MNADLTPEENRRKQMNAYARYSTMAFQMIIPIVLGVWGGTRLDDYFQTKFPAFTLILSLLGVFAAVYFVIRDLMKKK